MKASELRIGNWVLNEYTREPQQTYPMMIAQIASIEKEGKEVNMSGIPLTEEWLLKFGLKNENGFFKWHRSAVYQNQGRWIYGILSDDNRYYYHVCEPKYVHQLQNLYFALTGEEL